MRAVGQRQSRRRATVQAGLPTGSSAAVRCCLPRHAPAWRMQPPPRPPAPPATAVVWPPAHLPHRVPRRPQQVERRPAAAPAAPGACWPGAAAQPEQRAAGSRQAPARQGPAAGRAWAAPAHQGTAEGAGWAGGSRKTKGACEGCVAEGNDTLIAQRRSTGWLAQSRPHLQVGSRHAAQQPGVVLQQGRHARRVQAPQGAGRQRPGCRWGSADGGAAAPAALQRPCPAWREPPHARTGVDAGGRLRAVGQVGLQQRCLPQQRRRVHRRHAAPAAQNGHLPCRRSEQRACKMGRWEGGHQAWQAWQCKPDLSASPARST